MPALVPTAPSSSGLGMGTFSGLSSYMSLGLGSKTAKPGLVKVGEGEVLVVKESRSSHFFSLTTVVDAVLQTKGLSSVLMPERRGVVLTGRVNPKRLVILVLRLYFSALLISVASSIREPIYFFHPSCRHSTRYHGIF